VQEAGESRSLGGAPIFFPADAVHLVHSGQPCEFLLVQAALTPETLDALAEGAGGESRDGQEQFDRSCGRVWVFVNSGCMGAHALTSPARVRAGLTWVNLPCGPCVTVSNGEK